MKKLSAETFSARLLGKLAAAVLRRPRWFFWPQVVLAVACVFYTVKCLEFDPSRDNLVGSGKKYHQNFLRFKKEFPIPEDLVVVVESESPERNRQFVERLGAKLEARTNVFRDIFYKGDLKMMGSKALLFVPEDDLAALKSTLRDFRPFIEQFTHATNLVSFFDLVNTRFRRGKREQNAENESLIKALPALERIVTQATESLRRQGVPPSPGVTALFNAGEQAAESEYISFDHGRIYLVTAHAASERENDDAVEKLRALVKQTQREVPGLNVGLTGGPVLDHDEMLQSERDTTLATVLSLVVVFVIIIFGYGRVSRRIKADACLAVGMAYSMAFTTFAVGHLNILTITFAPILIGIAIDFGVHLIARFEEELRHGATRAEAIRVAMVYTGQGIFTGALTTAGAFLAMWLTDFRGIQEMGIICGAGLGICLVPMMTMLPALLSRERGKAVDDKPASRPDPRARIEKLWLARPRTVLAVVAVLCVLAVPPALKVTFDYNLLNMQSEGLPAVQFERKLINATPKSVLFGVSVQDSLDSAAEMEKRFKALPVVSDVESMSRFLQEKQDGKLALIRDIKQELATVRHPVPDSAPVKVTELSRTLYSLYGYLGLALDDVGTGDPELSRQFVALRHAIENLRKEMLQGPPAVVEHHAAKLGDFQQALFNDIRATFDSLREQDDRGRLLAADIPPALRNRFVGVTGKHLLQIYPRQGMDLWQRTNQEAFVTELQKVDPNATGTPIQLYWYTELLKTSYQEAALYALIAIAVMVLIHFRGPGPVILALMPVAIGTLWLVGIMGFFGIPFNPANIMTLPLVIGIGVTNGIHILNRFAEEQTPSILAKSTGKAVLISGLTTIAGFGSLIVADHQGIKSLGYVMAMGTATCMIAGLTCLPALLSLLIRWGVIKNRPSADNALSTLGREEPR